MKRLIAVVTSVAALSIGSSLAAQTQTPAQTQAPPAQARQANLAFGVGGLTFPLEVTSADQGSFVGRLQIVRFAQDANQIVAVGVVTGTLTDEAGVATAILRTVTLPLIRPAAAGDVETQQLACEILHLELGPLDLDLLGLVVHLDRVVLDIDAVPGAGNLLGNLLCAITNLLNGAGSLAQLVLLLNQLLALLGAVLG